MIKGSDKAVGTIADFTNMQIVKFRIELGRAGNGRAAEDNELASSFRSPCYVMDLWCLDVHAADENEVSPSEIASGRRRDIFIDKPD